ncbi:hypothetical protein L1987_35615 [Smallanthus sonchifolius]|uniref:Uncharacterized protein n=1 Tax=Smallanthus sonchifolius TaxID=185202 RepID=A0ACB9HC42_9ASTR|nr:hypothetical protein L1987_35615 [Smallanthus sonchifolius]
MESATVVLYPDPTIGHLVSMVEFGKLIHTKLSVIILIIPTPNETAAKYINTVTPSITFHHLPTNIIPPDFSSDHVDRAFGIPELYNPLVHQALVTISEKSTIKAVILDFFTNAAFQVSKNLLHLPTYYFFTGGASLLCVFLNIPTLHNTKDSNTNYFDVPGVPPIHASDLPPVIIQENNFINTSINMANSRGIILNTFTGFEKRAVDTLRDPEGVTPPIYLIGPLIASGDDTDHECLKWLKTQASKSVVFLCFGSMGVFKKQQLKEIAVGLERSGHRFLWVVHPDDENESNSGELDDILPEGFLTGTRDKGLVVKDWAPQQAVLSHGSVGVFVAVGVKMSVDGFVTAREVKEKVRELIAGEEGKGMRERVLEMSGRAKAAVDDGGSSLVELFKLTHPWVAG